MTEAPDASIPAGGFEVMYSDGPPVFITSDPATLALLDSIIDIAPFHVPVLITGESGVGKEVLARTIHVYSRVGDGPFVPVNSSALKEGLFESILFGHARGAFTGAIRRHGGLAAAADGGTLFLDEIGEITAPVQAGLLRFLDSGEYTPLGDSSPIRTSARIVAATNRDLAADVAGGLFREDLYYRLSAVVFTIPPLRERRCDILPLAEHFLSRTVSRHGLGGLTLSTAACRTLQAYHWPGNVRQLKNEVSVAALRKGRGRLEPTDLSADILGPDGGDPADEAVGLDEKLRRLEKYEILGALRRTGSNRSRAASILGLKRTTLLYRMRRHGIIFAEEADDG